MSDDNVQFLDAEQQTGGNFQEGLTFKGIAMQQLSRILVKCSCEWYGGHWDEQHQQVGNVTFTQRKYIEDKRDGFINSVNLLCDAILPHFDDKAKKKVKEFESDFENLNNEIAVAVKKKELTTEQAKDKRAEHHRKLFRLLTEEMKRLNYFESQRYEADA